MGQARGPVPTDDGSGWNKANRLGVEVSGLLTFYVSPLAPFAPCRLRFFSAWRLF